MTELLFYVIYFEIIKQLTNEEVRRFIIMWLLLMMKCENILWDL